jgi:hypothetical protein
LNAVLASGVVYLTSRSHAGVYAWTSGFFAAASIGQVAVAVAYLRTRERKTASKAVFGEG